jgi:hypothetical protein
MMTTNEKKMRASTVSVLGTRWRQVLRAGLQGCGISRSGDCMPMRPRTLSTYGITRWQP